MGAPRVGGRAAHGRRPPTLKSSTSEQPWRVTSPWVKARRGQRTPCRETAPIRGFTWWSLARGGCPVGLLAVPCNGTRGRGPRLRAGACESASYHTLPLEAPRPKCTAFRRAPLGRSGVQIGVGVRVPAGGAVTPGPFSGAAHGQLLRASVRRWREWPQGRGRSAAVLLVPVPPHRDGGSRLPVDAKHQAQWHSPGPLRSHLNPGTTGHNVSRLWLLVPELKCAATRRGASLHGDATALDQPRAGCPCRHHREASYFTRITTKAQWSSCGRPLAHWSPALAMDSQAASAANAAAARNASSHRG